MSTGLRVAAMAIVAAVLASCSTINVRLAMNEGVGHYKAKEFEKAVTAFKRAITIDPAYAEAYLDLGLTYMELYEPGSEHAKDIEYADGAIQAFKKYLSLEPTNEKAKEYLINVCNLSKRLPDAIEYFMTDYNKNPNDLRLVKTIGALYRMAGDLDKAIEWSEKVAQLEPNNPEALYTLGVYYWGRSYNSKDLPYEERMQILDKGLAALNKALALKPDYFEAITYQSLTYRQKAQYDIDPTAAMGWVQKADELLAKAMDLRNKAMAAQAAAAAASGSGASGQETTPAKSGGN